MYDRTNRTYNQYMWSGNTLEMHVVIEKDIQIEKVIKCIVGIKGIKEILSFTKHRGYSSFIYPNEKIKEKETDFLSSKLSGQSGEYLMKVLLKQKQRILADNGFKMLHPNAKKAIICFIDSLKEV